MASAWRTVRVFLSSTFRDMHAERDHLIKVNFPDLRERLLPHRVELYDVDLRWGITEEEAQNEQVIGLCLDQIDDCRPCFLAFLGHRYGWVPDKVPDETRARFPFIETTPGVSVTELEIRRALMLMSKGLHTLVLLRDEQAALSVPEDQRRDFVETDSAGRARLEKVKKSLAFLPERIHGMKPAPRAGSFAIRSYAPRWNARRYDRNRRAHGKLDGLRNFGLHVEEWLWRTLTAELALPAESAPVSALDAESDLHERFMEVRTRIYVGRADLHAKLLEFALARGDVPLMLLGESGSGKSAALARFVRDFRTQHPEVIVVAHFVGASAQTALLAVLERLTRELQRRFSLALPKAESSDEIVRVFGIALASVPAATPLLLVLDAIDQLAGDERGLTLAWLPERLPGHVRVFCSFASGSPQAAILHAALDGRNYVRLAMQDLDDAERRAILRAVPKLVAKTLDPSQVNRLLENPATRNPLFLIVALEELRGYGSFERLNQMIEALPREGDALLRIFDGVFERLEQEFSSSLVRATVSLLACSLCGLTGPQLVELTSYLEDDAADLYPVLRQLRPYLQMRGGLFDFFHTSIRRAAEIRYLDWRTDVDERNLWNRWSPERQPPAGAPSAGECEARERIIENLERRRLEYASLIELPYQLGQLRAWPRLLHLLGDAQFQLKAWEASFAQFRALWAFAVAIGGLKPTDAYASLLLDPASAPLDAVWAAASVLSFSGHGKEEGVLLSYLIQHFRAMGDEERLTHCLLNLALHRKGIGDRDGAKALFQEAEEICKRRNDEAGLVRVINGLAGLLRASGDPHAALSLLMDMSDRCRRINDWEGLAACLGNQGVILESLDRAEEAILNYREAETIARRINDFAGVGENLCRQASVWRSRRELETAMRLYQEGAEICRRFSDLLGLQSNLGSQAGLLLEVGDLENAMRLAREQETICRRINNPAELSKSLGHQAAVYLAAGEPEKAMDLYQQQEAVSRQANDPIGLTGSLGTQAELLQARGDLPGALHKLQEIETLLSQMGYPRYLAKTFHDQARILQAMGQLESAREAYESEEKICRTMDDPRAVIACLGEQALICNSLGQIDRALQIHREGESVCRTIREPRHRARSLSYQAVVAHTLGDLQSAMTLHHEAEMNARDFQDWLTVATSLKGQAAILHGVGQPETALPLLLEQIQVYYYLKNAPELIRALGRLGSLLAFDLARPSEGLPYIEEALRFAQQQGDASILRQLTALRQAVGDRLP